MSRQVPPEYWCEPPNHWTFIKASVWRSHSSGKNLWYWLVIIQGSKYQNSYMFAVCILFLESFVWLSLWVWWLKEAGIKCYQKGYCSCVGLHFGSGSMVWVLARLCYPHWALLWFLLPNPWHMHHSWSHFPNILMNSQYSLSYHNINLI